MTSEQIISALQLYRKRLEELHAKEIEADFNLIYPGKSAALNHLLSMIPQMEKFVENGQTDKVYRCWLGFMQGVLWSFAGYSLNELRGHNWPPEKGEENG